MSLNLKMEKILKTKNSLEKKLMREGLTYKEKSLLNEIKKNISEAPIDYEGPERMGQDVERQILQKQTPFHEHPAIPKEERDFIEVIASKRFKDSVEKVRRYMGNTQSLQGPNAFMNLMMMGMQGAQQIAMIESRHKKTLEDLAVDLVKKEMGIPEGALQFDAKLIHGGMGAAQGMQTQPQMPDEEDVKKAFKHTEDLENFADEFEKFNLERAKRRFINSLIQGAAFKGGHMYVLAADEIGRINPQLLNLYGVTQSLMEHLYWIFPNMEGMAASGGGQMGQSEVDDETDPPTVKARAATFPLLIHELVKGVYEVFGTHGLPDDPRQQEMIMGAEDTLPAEIWDSRLGPIFWEKFTATYPMELFDEDKKFIQHYLFMRFSKLDANEFFRVAKLILKGDPKGTQFIERMVDEITKELKQQEYERSMGDDDDDDDEDLDDIDLSQLGL
jgi:hypothetical protein